MKVYFSNLIVYFRQERSLILLLSVTDLEMLKQSKLIDHEINISKKTCSRKNTKTKM